MTEPVIALFLFFGFILAIWMIVSSKRIIQSLKSPATRERTNQEDVLKLVYHVQASKRNVGFDALAGALQIRPKKLLKSLTQMSEANLIRIVNDSIQLTEQGEQYAIQIVRTHRLWEKYLAEKTGIDKSEWHELAEKKEHQLSPEQTEQLYQELGRPRFDPHGDPIPTSTGEIVSTKGTHLPNLPNGIPAKIIHIEDEPKVVYEQILSHDLHMGSHVQITDANEQYIELQSEGVNHKLPIIVASNITVRELSETEQYEEGLTRLSSLAEGESATIAGLSSECRGANRNRLLDLGFVKGASIRVELDSPLKNPRGYLIKNTLIALRKDQADYVLINKETDGTAG